MPADRSPILREVLRDLRRALLLWAVALVAVCAMYTGFYPSMGASGDMEALVDSMPKALVTALGYQQIGIPGGWISSTVYGLLGPALLLVFAIGLGARLIAGQEEDGSLELELASPMSRARLFVERLAALWLAVTLQVTVVTLATWLLVLALDMDVAIDRILAGSSGLLLLILGYGTIAYGVGAATGRRSLSIASAAGLAVLAFMFDALGPSVEADWMTAISPFSWYLGNDPLIEGFDLRGLGLLATIPILAAIAGLQSFRRRDLTV